MFPVVAVFSLGVCGVALGLWLEELPRASRKVLPWSGVVLIAIAALGVLPEVAQSYGWLRATLWVALGFAVLWLINRYVHPVCPSCAHTHDLNPCHTRLHPFPPPPLLPSS